MIQRFFNAIVDTVFSWFTPRWRRDGFAVRNATRRYMRHFKHKISEERYEDLNTPLVKLNTALLRWDKESAIKQCQMIESVSESCRGFRRGFVAEMAESLFVILVVFLGIRTYYAQPFRIPTGSMQPSLNGIIVHPVEEIPHFGQRCWDTITKGSSYIEVIANTNKDIVNLTSREKWLLFIETVIHFSDGSTATVPSAPGAIIQYLKDVGKYAPNPITGSLASFKAGEPVIRARADAGDMVIVNRVSYHFRRPDLGETFVFDTRGIKTDSDPTSNMSDQSKGTHYIKRLSGLPGQTVSIKQPYLYINSEIPDIATFKRISDRRAPYNSEGYIPADGSSNPFAFITEKRHLVLKYNADKPNLNEYAALGDNTTNSLDSRYWGAVRQFNVLGPAAFTLWPFTEHWGIIP